MPATFTIAEENRSYDRNPGRITALPEILQILTTHHIGMNMIDLRSNRAARQQVPLVRHAAMAQRLPAADEQAAPVPPTPSITQRLQGLETLRATGTVTNDEYTAKRQQIIAELQAPAPENRNLNAVKAPVAGAARQLMTRRGR